MVTHEHSRNRMLIFFVFFKKEEYHIVMILYPTETLYALGVNALDLNEIAQLRELKERGVSQDAFSWLVRSVEDIERFAVVPPLAIKIIEHFLPGSLTLVLKAKINVLDTVVAGDRTIGFRISSDPVTRELIERYMEEHNAPLTCTSANVSGAPTLQTPGEILQQFGPRARMIDTVIDDDSRKGLASTIVRVIGDTMTILREGQISELQIRKALEI